MTTITIERKLLEQALALLSAPNHRIFSEPKICLNLRAALATPATAPDERIKELEAELAATEIAIAEYRQQCLDNAAEVARLKAESEERLQNCVALAAENERLRKDEERKPMTDKDIVRIYGLSKSTTDFARNIELFIAEGTP